MLRERLLVLPEKIYQEKLELLQLMEKQEEQELFLKSWEIQEQNKINNEVDAEGKLIYSSDVKRKSELDRRKLENENYKKLQQSINKTKIEIEQKKIYIEKLINEQKNLRALCILEGDDLID